MKQFQIYIKKYLVTGLFSVGALFMVLLFVTQFQPLLQNLERVESLASELADDEAEFVSLQQTTGAQLDEKMQIANIALPSEKDATLIYSLITTVAASHAINIESFSIDVGEVLIGNDLVDDPYAELSVSVDFVSPARVNTVQFISNLYTALPISEVVSMREVEGQGSLTLTFYYSNPIDNSRPLNINTDDEALLSEISGWTRP